MTLTSITNIPAAGGMGEAKGLLHTFTTTVDTYEVMNTVQIANLIAVNNYIAVATNNLLFKFEFTRDGVNWITSIEDYPISAAGSASLSAVRTALQYRVSVKPAVAGSHGTVTWIFSATNAIVPPEYRGAFAYEALTVTNAAAVGFTTATWAPGAVCANITIEDNPVRVRWDGTAPTTTEGHLLVAGDQMKFDFAADLFHFRVIATGGNAKVRVTYSR